MSATHQNSCRFAEQLIDYLYGESARAEEARIEAHLKTCRSCADEIKAFQTVRSSVLEWRAEEFETLIQPKIDRATIVGVAPTVETNESATRFGGWRQIFSFNPAFAAAAVAILIVCAGVVFFALNFSGNQEVAEIGDVKNAVAPIAAPTAENSNRQETRIADDKKPTEKAVAPVQSPLNAPAERERRIEPPKTAVKVSDGAKVETVNRRPKDAGEANKKSAPVKKQRVPNLNDAAEDEDDETIRLADLFAELDTK